MIRIRLRSKQCRCGAIIPRQVRPRTVYMPHGGNPGVKVVNNNLHNAPSVDLITRALQHLVRRGNLLLSRVPNPFVAVRSRRRPSFGLVADPLEACTLANLVEKSNPVRTMRGESM